MQPQEEIKKPLEQFGQDFTALAREGKLDPVIGRDEEIRRCMQVLSRRSKNNPVLIGEPGVGKTAIVEGLAQRIVKGDVPQSLKNKRLVGLEISSILAGAGYRGQFEERLQSVLKEIEEASGEIILFIDEIHTIVGAGKADDCSRSTLVSRTSKILSPYYVACRKSTRCIMASRFWTTPSWRQPG
jgi:ATP-dependent Clp protease ATP-binding subunit ClpB